MHFGLIHILLWALRSMGDGICGLTWSFTSEMGRMPGFIHGGPRCSSRWFIILRRLSQLIQSAKNILPLVCLSDFEIGRTNNKNHWRTKISKSYSDFGTWLEQCISWHVEVLGKFQIFPPPSDDGHAAGLAPIGSNERSRHKQDPWTSMDWVESVWTHAEWIV